MINHYITLIKDLACAVLFFAWVYFITIVLSKKLFILLKKNRSEHSSAYLIRKFIHIFAGGIFFLFPFVFEEIIIPSLFCISLGFFFYWRHLKENRYSWFQEEEKKSEVIFCFSSGIIIFLAWQITNSMWFGIIPVLFMALGDGVTGIVRGLRYGKQKKYWEGSVAMFIVSALIGGMQFGIGGVVAAFAATIVEKSNLIDDNITIPFISFIILLVFWLYFPFLIKPF